MTARGKDDRAVCLSRPCPPPGTKPVDMGIVFCVGNAPGSVVPLPKPYPPGEIASDLILSASIVVKIEKRMVHKRIKYHFEAVDVKHV